MTIAFVAAHVRLRSGCSFREEGVGGSEAALICLTSALADRGHRVTVFTPSLRELFGNVEYRGISELEHFPTADVLVIFRRFPENPASMNGRRIILWSTDLQQHPSTRDKVHLCDRVLCMSPYHREITLQQLPLAMRERVAILQLGVVLEDYYPEPWYELPKKIDNRLIYCSVPKRGLQHLASLFPLIRRAVPTAELSITSDYSLWGRLPGNDSFKRIFSGIRGVRFHGALGRRDLVALQRAAKVHAYPCSAPEGFCLAALECISAGAVPVTTNAFSLSTTVATSGLLIDGFPGEQSYNTAFVESVVRLLTDEPFHANIARAGRKRVYESKTWPHVAAQFEQMVNDIDSDRAFEKPKDIPTSSG